MKEFNIKYTDGVVVLGKRGSGKTYLTKKLVRNFKNKLIIDIVGNMKEIISDSDKYFAVSPQNSELVFTKFDYKKGNFYLVVDEADRIKYGDALQNIINLGRNWNIGYIATARRTARINKDYLANATHLFIFKHHLPQDIKMLEEWVDNIEVIEELNEHEFAYFYNEQYQFRGKI